MWFLRAYAHRGPQFRPFHPMDFCRVAGSSGELISWVAGWAYSCISLVPVVVKTRISGWQDGQKWSGILWKIYPLVSIRRQNIAIHGTDLRMIPSLLRMKWVFCSFFFFFFLCFFSPSYSSVPAVHSITTVHIYIYHCCQNERMCVRGRGWGVTALFWFRLFCCDGIYSAHSATQRALSFN